MHTCACVHACSREPLHLGPDMHAQFTLRVSVLRHQSVATILVRLNNDRPSTRVVTPPSTVDALHPDMTRL